MFRPSPAQQRAIARIEDFCGIRNPRTEFVDAAAFTASALIGAVRFVRAIRLF